jgi:cytochrome P450
MATGPHAPTNSRLPETPYPVSGNGLIEREQFARFVTSPLSPASRAELRPKTNTRRDRGIGPLKQLSSIGNGVWLFLTHPEQLAAYKADRKLDVPAVEEVLRYEAPVQTTSRILAEDREVAGCPMKKSQPVFMSLAAGNRDPDRFDSPEAFGITKKRASHVSFGGGAHICIGAPLARIEARRVYRKLFERYRDMKLPEQTLVWRALPFFRGIEKLEVEV